MNEQQHKKHSFWILKSFFVYFISPQMFCSVIAGLLHYFFLAAFAWMCIEGIHLYLIVVGVIYNKGFLHRNFYIFGYGSPAVVVAISATLGSKYYGTDKAYVENILLFIYHGGKTFTQNSPNLFSIVKGTKINKSHSL